MLKLKTERKRIYDLFLKETNKKNKNLIQSVLNIIDDDIKHFDMLSDGHKTERGVENMIKKYKNKLKHLNEKKQIIIFDDDFDDDEETNGSQAIAIINEKDSISVSDDLPAYVYYTA